MDGLTVGLFLISATALLGSPGPGIAALLATGRAHGWAGSLRFFGGLQVGLATAAAISAAGLFSVLSAFPGAPSLMTILATAYLLYLAFKIATSPVAAAVAATQEQRTRFSAMSGIFLGITNPKAYVAFASLFASRTLVIANTRADVSLKWLLCVIVIIVVDLVWLFVGASLHKATLRPRAERALNLLLASMIAGAAVLMLL